MNMRGTEGKTIMKQGWVNDRPSFSIFNKLHQIAEMSMAATNTISSAVLIQNKYLTRTKPALNVKKKKKIIKRNLAEKQTSILYIHFIMIFESTHAVKKGSKEELVKSLLSLSVSMWNIFLCWSDAMKMPSYLNPAFWTRICSEPPGHPLYSFQKTQHQLIHFVVYLNDKISPSCVPHMC